MSFVFIGNSHLDQFSCLTLPIENKHIVTAPGASIKGLGNPHSKTNLNGIISQFVDRSNVFVFHLGQVDFEFGYYYKSALNGVKLDKREFIDQVISIYEKYLSNLPLRKIVIGLNPTAINDMIHIFRINFLDKDCGESNKREGTGEFLTEANYKDFAHIYNESIGERNAFLRLANEALTNMCVRLDIPFFDLWPILFNNSKGELKEEYFTGGSNHHIAIRKELRDLLFLFLNTNLSI